MAKILKVEHARELIRYFYLKINPEELYLPPDSAHRHFRFQTANGGWVKIKEMIKTKEALKRQLIKYAPINAYYTVSCFQDPTRLGKKTDALYRNLFRSSSFLVDIDRDFLNGGKKHVLRAYNWLRDKGFKDIEIHFTGKGAHVIANDFYHNSNIKNPREREADCLKKMQLLADEMEKQLECLNCGYKFEKKSHLRKKIRGKYVISFGKCPKCRSSKIDLYIACDYPISRDSRRIKKLPGTITKYFNIAEVITNLNHFKPTKIGDYKLEAFEDLRDIIKNA